MSGLIDEVRATRRLSPKVARAIRQDAGISQQRLADELGVSRVTVTRWENGAFRPRGDTARRYAELIARLEAAVTQ